MVDAAVLLLLDLNNGTVLEGPFDNVGLLAGALDVLRGLEGGPELAEILDLDQVPNVGERGYSVTPFSLHPLTAVRGIAREK